MRIDLHTHSSCSDGTDSPAALVRAAAAAGLDVLGLTDHDTFAGWDEARAEAEQCGIGFVPGAEVSCRLAGTSVHLLAYLPDPTDAELSSMLERIREGRNARVPHILERLKSLGIELTPEDVAATSRAATSLGRPHVADALVAAGYAADRREAFDRWLSEGKPAYVTRYAPEPAEVMGRVVAAGGASVLAHPRGRRSRYVLTDSVIGELADAGLAGLEVDHLDHDDAVRQELRGLARDLDLVVTGSSDHHGAGKNDHDLGCCTTDEGEFARLLERARANAERSGRATPEPFLP
ncbi:PHP domain-containing protein [Actinopolymorpha alba]|uniref:PHP domain-containing protein n=1 Tax=Actinopolymorpha alba TaxID=533267 RepID=UPI00037ECC51|nr:PHP domain-containing protein [Actinopolymorpha alba]